MKKSILLLAFLFLCISYKGNAQIYWTYGSFILPTSNPSLLGTANPYDISFATDGIQTGWMDETNQYTGIGTGWGTTNRPQYQLDILENGGNLFRTIGNGNFNCDWESWIQTGTGTPALYGRVYVPANTTDFAMEASTHNSNYPYQGNLQFYTSQLVGSPVLRMQINGPKEEHHQQGQIYNHTGYVGVNISPLSQNMPVSLLTLDGASVTGGDGYRPWMKIGTYIGNNTDNMYVGLLDNLESNDTVVVYNRSDAVIAWGNDSTTASNAGPDVLRFIFTNYDTTDAKYVWGNEVGRWTPTGNLGVGNFKTSGYGPSNRLEVLTQISPYVWPTKADMLAHFDSNAQFRLTYTQSPSLNPLISPYPSSWGIHTDFQTDSLGNLLINPQNNNSPIPVTGSGPPNNPITMQNAHFVGIGVRAGFGMAPPANTLEINSGPASPYFTASGGNGSSGLKFRNLTSGNTPVKNPGPGYLSLDNVGNVIYVDTAFSSGGGGGSIGTCNTVPTVFPPGDNGAINLGANNNNFYYEGNGSLALNENDVLIGYPCTVTPIPAKLSVLQASNVPLPSTQASRGLYVENDDIINYSSGGGAPVIGLESYIPNPNNYCLSIAGFFDAPGNCSGGSTPGPGNYAIIVPPNGGLVGLGTSIPTAQLQVDGLVYDSGFAFINGGANIYLGSSSYGSTALYVHATIPLSSNEYGIMVSANSGTPSYGIFATANGNPADYAGYFNGNVYVNGNFFVNGNAGGLYSWYYSDSTIKTRVDSFSNAISIIKKLTPKTYYYNPNNSYQIKADTFMHYGFIAQQLRREVPCLVRTIPTPPQLDTGGHVIVPASTINAVDYNQVTPILTAAFQEQLQIAYHDSVKQQQTNDSLRYTLDSLRSAFQNIQTCLSQLCNNSHAPTRHNGGGSGNSGDTNSTTNVQDVTLSALSDAPLLYQNIPNPFSAGTKINYYLPAGTTGATIVFYDTYGNQLKQVPLNQTGNGSLNITPDNLTNGIYSYSLIVNGTVIDTKRMVLQK